MIFISHRLKWIINVNCTDLGLAAFQIVTEQVFKLS